MTNERRVLLRLIIDIAKAGDPCGRHAFGDDVADAVTDALEHLTRDTTRTGRLVLAVENKEVLPIEATWEQIETWAKDQLQKEG